VKKTIEEVESQLQTALSGQLEGLLQPLVPSGYRAYFYFYDRNGKKKRKDASAENWSPSDQIQVWFHPVEESPSATKRETNQSPTGGASGTPPHSLNPRSTEPSDPLSDLIRVLSLAEYRPGFDFVSLKWFRDAALPAGGYEWARSDSARQEVLGNAIARRLILTSKVPNPKDPRFPVTAIRVNRLMPEVKAILGGGDEADLEFSPVEIKGEPLSATVIRERHR
jgi:hypothetical protein